MGFNINIENSVDPKIDYLLSSQSHSILDHSRNNKNTVLLM